MAAPPISALVGSRFERCRAGVDSVGRKLDQSGEAVSQDEVCQVDTLLTALEATATASLAGSQAPGCGSLADQDEAAIQALLRGRYRPAVLNGQPIPLRVCQVILFRRR